MHRLAERHHFSAVNESGLSDSRWRNSAMTIARPTAASAAATVITKNTMIWPSADAERAAERDERQVHGVQHDLDRQQDRDQVAAHEHAGRADREQDRRQHAGSRSASASASSAPAASSRRASTHRADHRDQNQDRRHFERKRVVGEQQPADRGHRRRPRPPGNAPDSPPFCVSAHDQLDDQRDAPARAPNRIGARPQQRVRRARRPRCPRAARSAA